MTPASFIPRRAGQPEVHGHRGCRGLFPENTLPAFLHAVALGVDVIELDVVISADHQVVVSHEPWLTAQLGRGPQGELLDPLAAETYNLYQLPYATIRRCVVGEWPHPHFPLQQSAPTYRPLLREVIDAVEAACRQLGRPAVAYSVELKSTPAGNNLFHPEPRQFVELVLGQLPTSMQARTTLLSFDARVLQEAQLQAPTQDLCFLIEEPFEVSTVFQKLGFVPQVFGPDFQLVSTSVVQALYEAYPTLRIVPWTVNTPEDLQRVLMWQVNGITTDFPNYLLSMLQRTVN